MSPDPLKYDLLIDLVNDLIDELVEAERLPHGDRLEYQRISDLQIFSGQVMVVK